MFQPFLKNNLKLTNTKKYFIYFLIGFVAGIFLIYLYNRYTINTHLEKIDGLTEQIDSLSKEILIKENQRLELELEVERRKIEIQEIVVTKYIRPKLNSPDSSFQYLKRMIK
jgi:hypothetical protein